MRKEKATYGAEWWLKNCVWTEKKKKILNLPEHKINRSSFFAFMLFFKATTQPPPPCFHNSLQRPWLVTDLPKHFQQRLLETCVCMRAEREKSEMIYFNLSIFLLSLRSISRSPFRLPYYSIHFILELHVKIHFPCTYGLLSALHNVGAVFKHLIFPSKRY